jgi:creatinine amidohydrolase
VRDGRAETEEKGTNENQKEGAVGMEIEEATWTEVRDSPPDVVLLPVGSTEQHGPHAPLSTDALVAGTVAREAAGRTDAACACLPTVPVGVSEEHRAFDGTVYVSPETFRAYVSETLRSAPADRAVVVNGHGGNIDALGEACARLTRETPVFATHWTWWEAIDEGDLSMGHAGAVETSVLLHLVPELVGEPVDGAESWGDSLEGAPLAYDTEEFTENGVVGDATDATAQEGERLYEDAVGSLVRLVGHVAEL